MTGMVGNKWSFDEFSPMDVIPTAVSLTTYAGESEDFMLTPLDELVEQIAQGTLPIQIGRTFRLDEIVEAHRCMEENKAGGKIVVLTLVRSESWTRIPRVEGKADSTSPEIVQGNGHPGGNTSDWSR